MTVDPEQATDIRNETQQATPLGHARKQLFANVGDTPKPASIDPTIVEGFFLQRAISGYKLTLTWSQDTVEQVSRTDTNVVLDHLI